MNSTRTAHGSKLRLGSLELESRTLSAPVAGFTDILFRRVMREYGGCGLIFTEMVSAGGWVQGRIPPARLDGVRDEPRPLGVQLWDREPAMIREAAFRLRDYGVSLIDLNFGCPKRRIMGKQGAGATLLRDPATVGELVAAAVDGAGDIPVTAKIRLGPAVDEHTAVEVARSAEGSGAVAITVHGRTADQPYSRPCQFSGIARVAEALSIPVIANGDIVDAESALHALEMTGASGVMVARTALSRPWVFREIAAALRGEPLPPPPTLRAQLEALLRHHAAMVELHGDARGTILMRKFAGRSLAGIPGVGAFRAAVNRAQSAEQFRDVIEERFADSALDQVGVVAGETATGVAEDL